MDPRSVEFLDVMIAIAVIGVLGFLAGAVVLATGRSGGARAGRAPETTWVGFVPAVLLLIAAAALAVWLVSGGGHWAWGESIGEWQSSPRTVGFTLVMLALALIGVVGSGIYTAREGLRPPRPKPPAPRAEASGAPAVPTPSGLRLLGLAVPAAALLLMCWIALPRADQHALMLQLVYPASFGVALVLLVDKASRSWGVKGGAETVREWLFCDLMVLLLLLAFLNLRTVPKPETYACVFWDVLNLALWLAAFWIIDRTSGRARFLVGYAYLAALPLLLLVWRGVQGAAEPGEASWWGSIWPFLILSAAFLVFEAVTLLAAAPSGRQTLAAVKDGVFVVLYAVLLIVAATAAGQ